MSALLAADAACVQIVSEPLAAAIGVGLDLCCPYTQLIVDVGEGVTDCAIIRGGAILDMLFFNRTEEDLQIKKL